MDGRDRDILRRAGYEIDFVKMGVSSFEVEREVEGIISRGRLPIVIDYYGVAGFSFDRETGNVLVNPRLVAEDLERLLKINPNLDWKRYMREKIAHEVVHKDQEELLTARGISMGERGSIPYVMLKQLHALRVVPPCPKKTRCAGESCSGSQRRKDMG